MSAAAAWQAVSNTYNYISTPSFSIGIVEDYVAPEMGVSPGMNVKKEVAVENTGTASALVRVRMDKEIGDEADGLDPEDILLDTNKEDWVYDEEEGWYYYKESLPAGETTEPVLYGFSLDDESGNEYQLKDRAITVTAESLQNTENALMSEWGKSYLDLGMVESENWSSGITTKITFLSPDEAFDIETSKTDLFANFKDLLPGEKRTQDIQVTNGWSDAVTIYLTCMEDGQELQEGSALYRLLHDNVTISITDADGNVLYQGPVAGEGNCEISLGQFESGEEKVLTVSLAVSPEMDTESAGLLGSVRWEVTANEVITSFVQTSDLFSPGLAVMAVGMIGTTAGLLLLRKERKEGA